MSKKQSSVRHLYLYAKGHYLRSDDINNDLKKICSHITGVGFEHIDNRSVLYWLTTEAYKYITNYDRFYEFIVPLLCVSDKRDNYKIIIDKCISILAFTNVDDVDIMLGEVDETILPILTVVDGFGTTKQKEDK